MKENGLIFFIYIGCGLLTGIIIPWLFDKFPWNTFTPIWKRIRVEGGVQKNLGKEKKDKKLAKSSVKFKFFLLLINVMLCMLLGLIFARILYKLSFFHGQLAYISGACRTILRDFADNMLPNFIAELGSVIFTLVILNVAYHRIEESEEQKKIERERRHNEELRLMIEDVILRTWLHGFAFEFCFNFLDGLCEWNKNSRAGKSSECVIVSLEDMELRVVEDRIEKLSATQLEDFKKFLSEHKCWKNLEHIYYLMRDNVTMFEREIPYDARKTCLKILAKITNVLHEHKIRPLELDGDMVKNLLFTVALIAHWPFDFGMCMNFNKSMIHQRISTAINIAISKKLIKQQCLGFNFVQ